MLERPSHKQAADLAANLCDRIEQLATELVGAAPTSRSRGELRYRSRGSLSIELQGRKRGIWCDHETGTGGDALDLVRHLRGCSMAEAIEWAAGWLGMAPAERADHARSLAPASSAASSPNEHLDLSVKLARESVCLAGTIAEAYLRFRGCQPPRGVALRFHPSCPRGRGERLPAMLAVMTDAVSNRFVGVHRTFLRPDGLGKIEYGTAKMMLGNAGVIRLAPDDEITLGLGVCEGIETGLALMQRAGWSAVWAAGSAGAIAKFPVLAGIDCLTIFPDTDDSGAGRKAAEACTNRWLEAGREVQTIWPPGGLDWNDALTRAAA